MIIANGKKNKKYKLLFMELLTSNMFKQNKQIKRIYL